VAHGSGLRVFLWVCGGETSQWRPAVFEGTKPIEPYLGNPDYNFDYDMADQAIKWVRSQKAVALPHRVHEKSFARLAFRKSVTALASATVTQFRC
jgi:hypothetical protein